MAFSTVVDPRVEQRYFLRARIVRMRKLRHLILIMLQIYMKVQYQNEERAKIFYGEEQV